MKSEVHLESIPLTRGESVVLLLLAVLIAAFMCGLVLTIVTGDPTNDLTIYRAAGAALGRGENPYTIERGTLYIGIGEVQWRYLYPPTLAVLLSQLDVLGSSTIYTVWSAATSGSLVAAAILLWRRLQLSLYSFPLIVVAITLWPCTLDGLERGQVNAIVLLCVTVWWWGYGRNQGMYGGVATAVATLLKSAPALLLFPFFVNLTALPLLVFISVVLGGVSLTVYWSGVEVWWQYAEVLPSLATGGSGWMSPENLSFSRLLFAFQCGLSQQEAIYIQNALTLVVASSIAIELRKILKVEEKYRESERFRIAARVSLLLFYSSPLVWYNHALWLLVPIVESWRVVGARRYPSVHRALLFGLLVCVTGYRLVEEVLLTAVVSSEKMLLVEPGLFLLFVGFLWGCLVKPRESELCVTHLQK